MDDVRRLRAAACAIMHLILPPCAGLQVAVIKHHPMWAEWAPYFDHILAPLIERGYCFSICADVEATGHLVRHPSVEHVHMTGERREDVCV